MLDGIDRTMLERIADLHGTPLGAYNIRKDGKGLERRTTATIDIATKTDKPGIDVFIKPGTKNESVHIPVILTRENIDDPVYNDFDIGEGADVLVVAGCGIHSPGRGSSRHDGVHSFKVRKGARMRYVEKHYGEGSAEGSRILNPVTFVEAESDSEVQLEMLQIGGIDSTERETTVRLHDNATLILTERLLTALDQRAISRITIELVGANSSAHVISRSVAKDSSEQEYRFDMVGRNACRGHIQCDAIIMHGAKVSSTPAISALDPRAQLIHEAAIGRIEAEQLIKLESIGLSEKEAEDTILEGFLG
jgi:ABC-type transport system involved in Fe-S cluster assembly, permease component